MTVPELTELESFFPPAGAVEFVGEGVGVEELEVSKVCGACDVCGAGVGSLVDVVCRYVISGDMDVSEVRVVFNGSVCVVFVDSGSFVVVVSGTGRGLVVVGAAKVVAVRVACVFGR